MELNKIYNMDCLEGLKQLEDNSVDCVITYPPYNISRNTNFKCGLKGRNGMDFGEWDKGFPITEFIKELPRVLKKGSNVIIFNAWENLGDIATQMKEVGIEPKRCLIYQKINPAPFNMNRLFTNTCEYIVWGVYGENWTFNNDGLENGVFLTTVQDKTLHPTMKDIKIIKKLISVLSNSNDVILDCFMGSGTTAVACKELGRNYIGFELNKGYCKIAEDRLEKTAPMVKKSLLDFGK